MILGRRMGNKVIERGLIVDHKPENEAEKKRIEETGGEV